MDPVALIHQCLSELNISYFTFCLLRCQMIFLQKKTDYFFLKYDEEQLHWFTGYFLISQNKQNSNSCTRSLKKKFLQQSVQPIIDCRVRVRHTENRTRAQEETGKGSELNQSVWKSYISQREVISDTNTNTYFISSLAVTVHEQKQLQIG